MSHQIKIVVAITILTLLDSAESNAGFLDDLFGGQSPAAHSIAPAQQLDAAGDKSGTAKARTPVRAYRDHRREHARVFHPEVRRIAKVASSGKAITPTASILERTTGIMHDKSLRPGDALMTKDGVRIYTGPLSAFHDASQFIPLAAASHVSKTNRARLASLDAAARTDIGRNRSPATVVTGRSMSFENGENHIDLDSGNKRIRYVGP